jgi:hypothetical protein
MSDYEMVAILMSRDGMSREEVVEQINGFKEEILINACYDVEEEFMDEFGLDLDDLEELF